MPYGPNVVQGTFSGGFQSQQPLQMKQASFPATGGMPLPPAVRQPMESFFRTSFADVRIHVGAQAAMLGAQAITQGSNIHFSRGQYDPVTPRGLQLLGRELAHVVQQRAGRVRAPAGSGLVIVHDRHLEAEADRLAGAAAAQAMATRQRRVVVQRMPIRARIIQRNPTPPFTFRYAPSGSHAMTNLQSNSGGYVQYPSGGLPQQSGQDPMMSVALHGGFSDLPTGHKRAVTQSAVWGNISPNDAARELGLKCPSKLSWEWLHLVAFSISPTHVNTYLSAESINLLERTDQPQQIRENLVLGSAASNTQMLSFETILKDLMRAHKSWQLQLVCFADVEKVEVHGVEIPVCKRIDYHFQFHDKANGEVSPPVVLAFDTLSHHKPTLDEYSTNVDMLKKLHENLIRPPQMPIGVRTNTLFNI